MENTIRVVMVEDIATDAELAQRELKRAGMEVHVLRVETREQLISSITEFKPHAILSDFSLPHFDGKAALSVARVLAPQTPFIYLSGTIGEETAIDALKQGAADYVLKTNLKRLAPALRRAIEEADVRRAQETAERRFRDLIEFAPDAIILCADNGRIELVNARCEQLYGYSREELIGSPAHLLVPPALRAHFEQTYGEYLKRPAGERRSVNFEVPGMQKDGAQFPTEISVSPLQTGSILWLTVTVRDISERKLQEERIQRLSRIHAVLSGINAAIVRMRDRGHLLEEACRIVVEAGHFSAAWAGLFDPAAQTLRPLSYSGVDAKFMQSLVEDFSGPAAEDSSFGSALREHDCIVVNDIANAYLLSNARKDLLGNHGFQSLLATTLTVKGEIVGVMVLYSTDSDVFNDAEQVLLKGLAADLSYALEHLAQEDRLQRLAYFDELTDLPNRALFTDRLSQLLVQQTHDKLGRVALVIADVERFRHINDTLGREAGDGLLREVALRLQECLPDSRYIARISADSFAFAIRENERETGVAGLLEGRLAKRLGEPIKFGDMDVRVTIKAGIALFPEDGAGADALLRNAEAALKNAKAANQHYLFYTSTMNARTAQKLSLENRLRRALEQQEFILHYQPKINLTSGHLSGLEALIRWAEPGGNVVAPGHFIPVLEETGLIAEVGMWVMREAQRQHVMWSKQGLVAPRVAVNVSQLQLRHKDFVRRVLANLNPEALKNLELEITESTFMQDVDENVFKFAALREAGATVAIDDFGTGYSSLNIIAHLPIDTLKIDQSFVRNLPTSRNHKAIVSTVVALAHALELDVVAEGVETPVQSEMLTRLACDQGQGYLYSRPLPAQDIETILARGWLAPMKS